MRSWELICLRCLTLGQGRTAIGWQGWCLVMVTIMVIG